MLLRDTTIAPSEFEAGTGWSLKPEGACRGDVCIPLREPVGDVVDAVELAGQMGLPVIHDETHELWAVGPWAGGGRALACAEAPELTLPDLDGNEFALSSLRGQKVLLIAWAPY